MRYNRSFARFEDEKIIYAPAEFTFEGIRYNATNDERVYNAMGYYKYIRTEAPEKEGYYYTPYYEIENGKLVRKWQENEIEKEIPEGEKE